jgi:hypothetical protein
MSPSMNGPDSIGLLNIELDLQRLFGLRYEGYLSAKIDDISLWPSGWPDNTFNNRFSAVLIFHKHIVSITDILIPHAACNATARLLITVHWNAYLYKYCVHCTLRSMIEYTSIRWPVTGGRCDALWPPTHDWASYNGEQVPTQLWREFLHEPYSQKTPLSGVAGQALQST